MSGIFRPVNPGVVRYAIALASFGLCLRAEPPAIRLWPGSAPGERGGLGEEKDTTKPSDNKIAGRPVIRIGNVSEPSITVYRPPADRNRSEERRVGKEGRSRWS